MQILNRPVWASLSTRHAALSEGSVLARRYLPDVNLFASACDDSEAAQAALAELVRPGGIALVLQVPEIVIPRGLTVVKSAPGVQMVAAAPVATEESSGDVVTLSDSDVPEMLALAALTEPGPFLPRTHAMGSFRGIRIDGRLVAMAGERMRFPGFTEVSGVCTHPDYRGRGLAGRLSVAVAAGIVARGETPFLHAWADNVAAISLYEKLGFRHRCDVNVAVLMREGA
jgi:predicted GNAT family acetyltransferase